MLILKWLFASFLSCNRYNFQYTNLNAQGITHYLPYLSIISFQFILSPSDLGLLPSTRLSPSSIILTQCQHTMGESSLQVPITSHRHCRLHAFRSFFLLQLPWLDKGPAVLERPWCFQVELLMPVLLHFIYFPYSAEVLLGKEKIICPNWGVTHKSSYSFHS